MAATQSARRRTVTVTPIFEAVTGRMLAPVVEEQGTFISAESLTGGAAVIMPTPTISVTTIKTRTKEVGFQVLCGSASALLDSIKEGASGGILALAACAPQACQEIYLAWKDHDLPLAEEKQKLVSPVNKRIVGELGIAGVKYICDFNGYYGGQPRSPLLGLTSEEKSEVERLLANMRN